MSMWVCNCVGVLVCKVIRVSASLDDRGTYAYRVVSMGQSTLRLNRQKACSRVSHYCRMERIRSALLDEQSVAWLFCIVEWHV